MERLLYPIPEALEQVPVSRTTFYQEIQRGAIGVIKIGRRTFVTHDQLERYVRSLTNSAPAEEAPVEAASVG